MREHDGEIPQAERAVPRNRGAWLVHDRGLVVLDDAGASAVAVLVAGLLALRFSRSQAAGVSDAGNPALLRRTLSRLPAAILVPAAVLFGGAGTWRWPAAWAYLALLASGILGSLVVFVKFQPELAEERARWREGARWDKPFLTIIGVIGPLGLQLVCALDKRFEWSAEVTAEAQIVAGVLLAGGIAMALWAMAVNPFFSATVRIQTDRGHTVIDRGPYRYVRHPGYAGMVLTTLAGPLLLGTLWGFVPAALLVAAMVVRTALEDRTLHAELAGYALYAARVRSRILPPIW